MANGDTQQKFTPAEFAAKIKTKYPQYASIPDDQLVSKITTKYPQYKSWLKQDPLVTGQGMIPKAPVPKPPALVEPYTSSSYGKAGPQPVVPSGKGFFGTLSHGPGNERPLFTSAEARKSAGNELALGGSLIGGEAAGASSLLIKMLAQFVGAGGGKALGGVATGQKPTMQDVKEGAEVGGGAAASEGLLGLGGKLLTPSTWTRLLRGPGGSGDIEAPIPSALRRELEAKIPRNEPVGAREEMRESLNKKHEEFAKKVSEIEDARQKELADLEKFKEQHAASIDARAPETPFVESTVRINKILGVGQKEIRVGKVPQSLDDFGSNPARGVQKAGITEEQLAKMKPLERLKAINEAKDMAGEKLDDVLKLHSNPADPKQFKTIDVSKILKDTFAQIPDKSLAKLATNRVTQLLAKQGITKPLSQLTPMEARIFQRSLDDFANFAPEGTVKSFSDIATSLRRGISKATREAIPETAELDRDYGDLAGAVKAARRQAAKYATTPPKGSMVPAVPF